MRIHPLAAVVMKAVAFSLLLVPIAQLSAAREDVYYFAWANQSEAKTYFPDPLYEWHALGGKTWIERLALGHYRLRWRNGSIGLPFHDVLARSVTAYGSSSDYCNVNARNFFEVSCFDASGNPTDSRFTAFVQASHFRFDEPYAAAFAHQPSTPSYVASGHTAGGIGETINVTRLGVGTYNVEFVDFAAWGTGGGNVQVTADSHFSPSADHRCTVHSWGPESVQVDCFDSSGVAADTAFWIVYQKASPTHEGVAFAWADAATTPSYTPSSFYSSNPTGGAITANRSSTGVYSMTFAGMGDVGQGGGHVQVTAYSSVDHRCKVDFWSGDTVHVLCFDTMGNPVDSAYTVSYRKPVTKLLTEYFAAAEYAGGDGPDGRLASNLVWNRFGDGYGSEPVHQIRLGTGHYEIEFTGMDRFGSDGGNAQVTSRSFGANRCKVEGWWLDTVSVRCFDSAGNAVDEHFNVALFMPKEDNEQLAYVWTNSPSDPIEVPDPQYAHNPSGSSIQVARLSTGLYRATFAGLDAYGTNDGVPFVTAYGTGPELCKLVSWGGDIVDVLCMTPGGTPTDSRFSLIWFKPDADADGFALSYGDLPTTSSYAPLTSRSYNPIHQGIHATRQSFGEYEMQWTDLGSHNDLAGDFALVSALGTDATACSGSAGAGADVVAVYCHDENGLRSDTAYAVVRFTPLFVPEPVAWAQLAAGAAGLAGLALRRGRGNRGRQ